MKVACGRERGFMFRKATKMGAEGKKRKASAYPINHTEQPQFHAENCLCVIILLVVKVSDPGDNIFIANTTTVIHPK